MAYYYNLTNYPNLFKHCYWGNHVPIDNHPSPEIVAARNRFVEEYKIVAWHNHTVRVRMPQNGMQFNHQEFWEDDQGRIVHIFSHNYKEMPSNFVKISSLYTGGTVTGLRIVETLKSKRKAKQVTEA